MRIQAFVRSTLLLLFLASSPLVYAQFQQPTDEELKMTADPKAPGAAAVYLNVTEIADNPHHFETTYVRIKILTEKGADLATVDLPYQRDDVNQFQITEIKGRTIHPDGTVFPFIGKPADLLAAKTHGTEFDRKVFTLPSVQVGSIIEYSYQLVYNDDYYYPPTWLIQRPYLVHKAHYLFTPNNNKFTSLSVWKVLPPGVTVNKDAEGRLSLDLTDIPAAPNEEWMPPIETTLYRVRFYFRIPGDLDSFWQVQGNNWSKNVQQFTDPSKSLRDAVGGFVAAGDSEMDKAKKLYGVVQTLENTDFTRDKSIAERKQLKLKAVKHADDVWTQKSGTRTEIALLYLAMLRAAGLTGYAMRIVDRGRSVFDPGYLYFDQLDDTIVLLAIDGKEIVLDPGQKMCPFRTVSWRHSAATGLRQTPSGSAIATTPRQIFANNILLRTGEIAIDRPGSIEGNFRFTITGQEALYWRQRALEIDETELKKQFDQWIAAMVPSGVEGHVDRFVAIDNPEVNLSVEISAKGNVGTATSKRLMVPAFFFASHSGHPFVDQQKRLTSVDMRYGETTNDEVKYHLPAGVEVESAPQPGNISWEDHEVLITKSKTDPGTITFTRTLARSFTLAPSTEYPALRDFYQKVAASDQQQLVLAAISTGKEIRQSCNSTSTPSCLEQRPTL
jgi:hypothetical protein